MVYPDNISFAADIGTGPDGRLRHGCRNPRCCEISVSGTINYDYGSDLSNTNAALDNAIGRLDAIVDGANSGDAGTVLEQYSYLGLNTIVQRNHPQTGINLTYLGSSGSIGAGGDQYVGLDQFGRVVNQNWVNSSGATVDGYTYSYDANGNVTAKNNTLDSAYSQTFTYDQLNRLASSTQGGSAYQSWNLDSQGNWSSFTNQGSTQTETANAQNQITSISGSTTPTYDAAGNMISGSLTGQPAGSADTLTYDAWNRLVSVSNASGQVIAQYTYNAMGYRITETYPQGGNGIAAGTTLNIYYDSSWQAIETRTDGTASSNVTSQTVWSAAYINAVAVENSYTNNGTQISHAIYFEQDAQWNTTSIVSNFFGQEWVAQRYVYSPYGNITVLNADWSTPPSGTQPAVSNLYQGMTLDPVTGLYYARNRNYSPSLGRWINQDPLQYINGANTYQFVMSNPVGNVDPWGLAMIPPDPFHGNSASSIRPNIGYKIFDPNGGLYKDGVTGQEPLDVNSPRIQGQLSKLPGYTAKTTPPFSNRQLALDHEQREVNKFAKKNGGNMPPGMKRPTPKGGRKNPCQNQAKAPPNMKPFALPQIDLPGMPPWMPPLSPQWQQEMDGPIGEPSFMPSESGPKIPGYFQGPNDGLYNWPGGEESPLPPPPSVQLWMQMDEPGVDPLIDG